MDKKIIDSCYVPLDIEAAINEHGELVQSGEPCGIDHLKDRFALMKGHVNGWYGWPNDGKTLFLDQIMMVMSVRYGWKWCIYRQEDMNTIFDDKGRAQIKANKIYKNLAWTYSGKTWNKAFANKHRVLAMTLEEEKKALDFVSDHFFVVYTQDRELSNLMNIFTFMFEKFKVHGFLLDPWNTVKLPTGKRDDQILVDAFIEIKEFALKTNTSFNIISHPKSISDVKENPKDPGSPFKVVNQYMQIGGAAWDMKMDGQYSVYRPKRHIKLSDPDVEFWNLKQRDAEIVGVERGKTDDITFDKFKRQYYFGGVNPMDGTVLPGRENPFQATMTYEPKVSGNSDEVPF